jgi:GT2 family glycosyltransferase
MPAEPLPPISVVIPSWRPDPALLGRLYASLLAQTHADFEVIVVDDASPEADYALLSDPRFRVVRLAENGGPARARNRGAVEARHGVIFFTDTDCELAPDCLEQAARHIAGEAILVGDTRTRTETVFGRAVALLGFPGGGCLGFHNVWRVDAQGYTRSFSSCNLAIRKETFNTLGCFNETFPVAGGEDTVLARHAADTSVRIRYVPEQVVYHVEKTSLQDFLKWQIIRGRGNYYIRRHVPEVGGYLRLRVWTYANSIKAAGPLYALPVTLLWVMSVLYQGAGYRREARRALEK